MNTLTSKEQDFTLANEIADAAVQRVCELPDYTSPDDQPDLLQCKPWELHACVVNAIEQIAPHLMQPPALETVVLPRCQCGKYPFGTPPNDSVRIEDLDGVHYWKRPCQLGQQNAQKASERPMTLGRLVLETARGTVKERTITGKELDEIRANMARYFKGPLQFREPQTDSEGPMIYDAAGNQVAMLYWPCHPVEETDAAERATYALGRAMAAGASESEPE